MRILQLTDTQRGIILALIDAALTDMEAVFATDTAEDITLAKGGI